MEDKVYGICGTNKCKREVIPMENIHVMDTGKYTQVSTSSSEQIFTFDEVPDEKYMYVLLDMILYVKTVKEEYHISLLENRQNHIEEYGIAQTNTKTMLSLKYQSTFASQNTGANKGVRPLLVYLKLPKPF